MGRWIFCCCCCYCWLCYCYCWWYVEWEKNIDLISAHDCVRGSGNFPFFAIWLTGVGGTYEWFFYPIPFLRELSYLSNKSEEDLDKVTAIRNAFFFHYFFRFRQKKGKQKKWRRLTLPRQIKAEKRNFLFFSRKWCVCVCVRPWLQGRKRRGFVRMTLLRWVKGSGLYASLLQIKRC